MSLHAHVTSRSRDCDGEYRSGYTYPLSIEEQNSDFTEIEFKERVIATVVSVFAVDGTLSVSPNVVNWHETTDEGYRSSCIEWCEDETCEASKSWQRDMSAEKAGY